MMNFGEITEFRRSEQATDFAQAWIRAQEAGDLASEWHMNLLGWSSDNPAHVLGIVLNLLDLSDENEAINEMVAIGPAEWLVEHCPDEFVILLREAIRSHPGFALATSWKRAHSEHPRWKALHTT
jgi:hypothetical protein